MLSLILSFQKLSTLKWPLRMISFHYQVNMWTSSWATRRQFLHLPRIFLVRTSDKWFSDIDQSKLHFFVSKYLKYTSKYICNIMCLIISSNFTLEAFSDHIWSHHLSDQWKGTMRIWVLHLRIKLESTTLLPSIYSIMTPLQIFACAYESLYFLYMQNL